MSPKGDKIDPVILYVVYHNQNPFKINLSPTLITGYRSDVIS